jgi:hypothetical protein
MTVDIDHLSKLLNAKKKIKSYVRITEGCNLLI